MFPKQRAFLRVKGVAATGEETLSSRAAIGGQSSIAETRVFEATKVRNTVFIRYQR
jgi:hypothetical protein